MVLMSVAEEKTEEFGNLVLDFIDGIHGEGACEIRFIPENRHLGKSISLIKIGNFIYTNDSKGNKVRACDVTKESFGHYLNECLMHAGHTSVCFTVNSPNFNEMKSCVTKNEHITNGGIINCQFVDIDAPKEIRHDNDLLKSWKLTIKRRILSFSLRPSIVVETKNGYHVYWLLANGEHRFFKQIQMQLVQFFQGDSQCVNVSRVLRLPFFLHRKDIDKPYPVNIKFFEPENRYTQEEIKNALPELEADIILKVIEENSETEPINISNARRGDILELLIDKIGENIVREKENKIIMHCIMPNHQDRHPSGWFDKDHMYYHCSGCGSSFSIVELAKELGWKDIIEAWNKYDIDINSEIIKIMEQMINVADLPHLSLNLSEQEQVKNIALKVIYELSSFGQDINLTHKQYIHDIVQILFKANKEKPYLIPLDMGGGKSLIIEIFLQEMIKNNVKYGAIVVKERIEDVIHLANKINSYIGKDVAFPMYGFDKQECLLNTDKTKKYEYCIERKGKRCPLNDKCRYATQSIDQQKYPIIVITSERLRILSDNLTDYIFFNSLDESGEKYKRELLIIDEKPKMTFVKSLNLRGFKSYTTKILEDLKRKSIDGDLTVHDEFEGVVELVEKLYIFDVAGRETFEYLDSDFCFSEEFWKRFNSIYDYTQDSFEIPKILESIIKNGGHIEAKTEEKVIITTSNFIPYNIFNNFKTVILDGTADIDIEYQHDKFHVFDFESLRTYEGLTFNICNYINGSKTSMEDEDKVKAFCDDVISIAKENPHDKIFLPVFKKNRTFVEEYLEEYINCEDARIIVAHFGSTRGSNRYKDCSIVVLGGILHKTEHHYIGKSMAMYDQKDIFLEDTSCFKFGSIRRFNDTNIELVKILDMLVDYSQEIKRSKQRNNSQNIDGKVYVFHNDKILLDMLNLKFPGSKVEEWIPKNIVEMSIISKSNNKNVQGICDYIKNHKCKEIAFTEVRNALGLSMQAYSNTLKNPKLRAFLTANHIDIQKRGRSKLFVKIA